MSGSTNAALNASASVPLPKSQAMYLVRTRPITLESAVETIRITVAENAECACVGRSAPNTRAKRDRDAIGGESFTEVDFKGRRPAFSFDAQRSNGARLREHGSRILSARVLR